MTYSATCGDCNFWMKSSACPQEVNVKGMSRGPHCNSLPCKKFQLSKDGKRNKLQYKLDLLNAEISQERQDHEDKKIISEIAAHFRE